MLDLLNLISAIGDDRDPQTQFAVELADHVATCPVCRDGSVAACPKGLALTHAVAAATATRKDSTAP